MFPANESRKLTGLIITLVALLALVVVAVVAVTLFGVGESLFAQIGGFITTLGATHQGAQTMADRSTNYAGGPPVSLVANTNVPPLPTSPVSAPPGAHV